MRCVGSCKGAFHIRTAFESHRDDQYPLKNSSILDSGTTIHIFNEISRFIDFRASPPGDYIWAGDNKVRILGYGKVQVRISNKADGKTFILCLRDVAYCPDFACNLVSLFRLHEQGFWWDNRPAVNALCTISDNRQIANLEVHFDQFVLEYLPLGIPKSTFLTRRNNFNSWTKRKPVSADAWRWHLRLGHPGREALEHFVGASTGAKIRGPLTVECDSCGLSKITKQISREKRDFQQGPGLQLAVDFHDYEKGYEGYTDLMLITDRWSGFIWDYYLEDRTSETIIQALRHLLQTLERYKIHPRVVECDNEIYSVKPRVRSWLEKEGKIKVEPSAPYTQSQNGAAERSGGVVKEKGNAMREGAKLPAFLWPEIQRAAVYLSNRTPRYTFNWKTPIDRFYTYLAHQDGVVTEDRKPQQAHLKVYGCKAFAMNTEAHKKSKRLERFNAKAWIGYLVGYQSTNIYRIWVPKLNRVVCVRDVIFDEETVFDGNIETLKDDLLHVTSKEFEELINRLDVSKNSGNSTQEEETNPETDDSDVVFRGFFDADDNLVEMAQSALDLLEQTDSNEMEWENPYPTPAPTPPSSLPACLFAASIGDESNDSGDAEFLNPWKAAFNAGRLIQPIRRYGDKVINYARLERLLRQPGGLSKIHRHDLPEAPKWHRDLVKHPLGLLFEQAERDHLQGHEKMRTWIETPREQANGKQILDCMWVYTYKFDKHGRLQKCKARLVVRGDQQPRGDGTRDTYAATLAVRSFRILMAIAARFDLELLQYDAVNAFVNADLDEDVYMRMPPGYRKAGNVLHIKKALFGLRKSPLLWQRFFRKSLLEIGFQSIPHEPCCLSRDGILIFFYVDDIVLAYQKMKESLVQEIVRSIKARYKLSGGEALQWFLGIEVIRDRKERKIWLSQASYIEKIARLMTTKQPDETPMNPIELQPYTGKASQQSIQQFQRKIGSIMYAAVVTRLDVAFAASRLSRFLVNPSDLHHAAADRVLSYLERTKTLALLMGQGDDFVVYSDASFADNTLDRKSSQAYLMRLFGGIVGWRANKQSTVTTSTTEAELLALSQAAKEGEFVSRLLRELTIRLDKTYTQIYCDNLQTIRLINEEIARLQTRLRHVDIHNHWLRQEVQDGRIKVEYKPSSRMLADGLTKALPTVKFVEFVRQVGLVGIPEQLATARSNLLPMISEEDLNIDLINVQFNQYA